MQSSQGRTTSGRTFRIQLDVPRAVVVVLLLASLAEVRSLMPCSNASDCNYEGCNNDATPLPLSPTTCGYHQSLQNSFCYFYYGTCPERPCPAGTFNSVSSCVSGGDGYGGRIVGRGGGTECSCTACPAGTYSVATGATSATVCVPCGAGTYSPAGASACEVHELTVVNHCQAFS